MEPANYAWIIPGRVAVAERPGRGGRQHRRALREQELDWWTEQGVRAVVSGMRSRHGLAEYVDRGLEVRWHPLRNPEQARDEVEDLAAAVRALLDADPEGAVLVHSDQANEWLAAIDAQLRMTLGLARTARAALRAAKADGLPVGSLATSIVGLPMSAAA